MSSGIPTAKAGLKLKLDEALMQVSNVRRLIRVDESAVDHSHDMKLMQEIENTVEYWKEEL